MTKPKYYEKQQARKLRKQGLSVQRIAKKCKIAQSTAYVWTKDIELTLKQKQRLEANKARGRRIGHEKAIQNYKEKREKYREQGRSRTKNAPELFRIGCMLYWAEGAKHQNSIHFSNSDPSMIKLFMQFLIECFDIEKHELKVKLALYETLHSKEEIEQFWLDYLGLSSNCLHKSWVREPRKTSRKKILEWGVCGLRLYRVDIIQQIYGGIEGIIEEYKKK